MWLGDPGKRWTGHGTAGLCMKGNGMTQPDSFCPCCGERDCYGQYKRNVLRHDVNEVRQHADLSDQCLMMIREAILRLGKSLYGDDFSMEATPPMMYPEAIRSLVKRASERSEE